MAREQFARPRPVVRAVPATAHFPVVRPDTRSSLRQRLGLAVGTTVVVALGLAVVASAQSQSPFASKRKVQAWEVEPANTPQPVPPPITNSPAYSAPRPLMPTAPTAVSATVPKTAPTASPDWSAYQPAPTYPTATAPKSVPSGQPLRTHSAAPYAPHLSAQGPSVQTSTTQGPMTGTYGASTAYGSQQPIPTYPAPSGSAYGSSHYGSTPYGGSSPYGASPYASQTYGSPNPPAYSSAPPRRSWTDRLGLSNLSTFFRGGLRAGGGVRDRDGWEETFVADADLEGEVSAITQGGLEYGVHGQVRAQYDEDRKGFARRLPDCPPTLAGCPSVSVGGVATSVRAHTSQFYTFGPDVSDDTRVALESAHLFLRSAYGDVTVGRDDGSAFLFSLGAPTLLNVGASNSPVDYTGLDAVKTVNDASGFAEKITYTSPRLLGDRIGVGVQFGASYAPDAEACGVDYCVDPDDIAGVLTPDLEDIVEAGLSLDRRFANGLDVEGTLTYARGSEQSGLSVFDDLETFGAGIEVSLSDWTVGGSWLTSNQGLADGDYEAFDIGLTWQPSQLGFTLGYGRATDDLVGLTSDQFVGGVSYDLNDQVRFGAGVQYTDRESLRDVGGTAQFGSEDATAIFIEGGITF